jgi:hypothetical protein
MYAHIAGNAAAPRLSSWPEPGAVRSCAVCSRDIAKSCVSGSSWNRSSWKCSRWAMKLKIKLDCCCDTATSDLQLTQFRAGHFATNYVIGEATVAPTQCMQLSLQTILRSDSLSSERRSMKNITTLHSAGPSKCCASSMRTIADCENLPQDWSWKRRTQYMVTAGWARILSLWATYTYIFHWSDIW